MRSVLFDYLHLLLLLFFFACNQSDTTQTASSTSTTSTVQTEKINKAAIVVLGTVQDAGSPHMACKKNCCKNLFENPDIRRQVVSLGILDPQNKQNWLMEASPNIVTQMKALKQFSHFKEAETPDGIFLTHAHIGHYVGLMHLGKEAMNAKNVPVYAMPRMKTYLEQNGPWSQLVNLNNIAIREMQAEKTVNLSSTISVRPFRVPHRDEYSETVGYVIEGPNKKALFIPDIDKWEKWEKNIIDEIAKVDYAFLDATFFDGVEINNRDISQIPHPFIIESMEQFKELKKEEKQKIYFIHFNHTNPVLTIESEQAKEVIKNGFNIAQYHQVVEL